MLCTTVFLQWFHRLARYATLFVRINVPRYSCNDSTSWLVTPHYMLGLMCGDYTFGVLDLHPYGIRDIVYDQSKMRINTHTHTLPTGRGPALPGCPSVTLHEREKFGLEEAAQRTYWPRLFLSPSLGDISSKAPSSMIFSGDLNSVWKIDLRTCMYEPQKTWYWNTPSPCTNISAANVRCI